MRLLTGAKRVVLAGGAALCCVALMSACNDTKPTDNATTPEASITVSATPTVTATLQHDEAIEPVFEAFRKAKTIRITITPRPDNDPLAGFTELVTIVSELDLNTPATIKISPKDSDFAFLTGIGENGKEAWLPDPAPTISPDQWVYEHKPLTETGILWEAMLMPSDGSPLPVAEVDSEGGRHIKVTANAGTETQLTLWTDAEGRITKGTRTIDDKGIYDISVEYGPKIAKPTTLD